MLDDSREPRVIVQLMDNLGLQRGGLTRAVYERFSLLSEGRRHLIVTSRSQTDLRDVYEQIKASGEIPPSTELLNFHEEMGKRTLQPSLAPASSQLAMQESDAVVLKEASGDRDLHRIFRSGRFVGLVSTGRDGTVKYADDHGVNEPWRLYVRDTYRVNGSIQKREYFDADLKVRYRIYANDANRPYLTTWVSPGGGEYRVVVFGPTGDDMKLFSDMRSALAWWLEKELPSVGERQLLFSDEPATTYALGVRPSSDCKIIAAIHSTHMQDRPGESGPKSWVKWYTENKDAVERFVFFTRRQEREFEGSFGLASNKAVTIPHAAPDVRTEREDRDPNTVVVVSRFDEQKRIDHALQAFALARKKAPQLRLELYGTGPSEQSLRKLAKDLNLDGHVEFMGYTRDAVSAFSRGAVSLLTSRFEGFGLVITESMAAGTPVIAFDVDYGPRETIVDGHNGFLVPSGDVDAMARRIVECMKKPKTWGKLRDGAVSTAAERSRDQWARGWRSLVVGLD